MTPDTPAAPAAPPPLEMLPVLHFRQYVIGFPLHVAITLRSGPHTSFNQLLFPDLADLRDSVAAEWVRQDAPGRFEVRPRPVIEPEAGLFAQRLEAGETRRMLVDLSPLLPAAMPPGRYRLQLSYLTRREAVPAPPIEIVLREASDAERGRLATLAGDRPRYSTWAEWSLACPAAPSPAALPQDRQGPLGFVLLLRHLFCGSEPLNRIAATELDGLPPLYAPEVEALKAELSQHRADRADYAARRSALLAQTPGLGWWLQMIDAGGAYCASFGRRP